MPDGFGDNGYRVEGTLTRDDRRSRELHALHLRFEHGLTLHRIARRVDIPFGDVRDLIAGFEDDET